ncbi:TetR/AcrR family transcriptional regulator [Burkholderia sp. F1]|uniref:TetR/AcrR family transcriptional regulator n=1 Tax=Burkholderia sp. F1 TaxID=3366817 RepID=UPI003D72F10B
MTQTASDETGARPSTVKNKRGLETRQRVLVVTKALIGEHGYSEVTLDQISSAAGVAKSSLLWHFGSKEALLAEAVTSLFQEVEAQLLPEAVEGLPVAARTRHLFERVAAYFTRNPEAKGIIMSLLFSGGVPEQVRAQIQAGWHEHAVSIASFLSMPERPFPPDLARTMVAMFHGAYCQWYADGRTQPIITYLASAQQLILDWLDGPR